MPPKAPKVAITTFTLAHCYDIIIGEGIKSEEKYDYLLADSFFDVNIINQFYKITDLISVFIFSVANGAKFVNDNEKNRTRGLIPINKKYNINLRNFLRVHYFPESKR